MLVEQEKAEIYPYGSALIALWLCNMIFVVIAWFTVYLEPLAGGSGIPEIKCFLNGMTLLLLILNVSINKSINLNHRFKYSESSTC